MTTELVPISETVALPITVDAAIEQWEEYQDLTKRLLEDSDYQKMGSGQFKKKSAWRKYARAFNLADAVTYEHVERSPDGFPLWARIRVKAIAPNGRETEADHECHVTERCCPGARSHPCPKANWDKHACCTSGCDGRIHWSHPGDLPATALTRAKNRAIADLIGAGEVSADEMTGEPPQAVPKTRPAPHGGTQRAAPSKSPAERPARNKLFAIMKKHEADGHFMGAMAAALGINVQNA